MMYVVAVVVLPACLLLAYVVLAVAAEDRPSSQTAVTTALGTALEPPNEEPPNVDEEASACSVRYI